MATAFAGVQTLDVPPNKYDPEFFRNNFGKLNNILRRISASGGGGSVSILSGDVPPALGVGAIGDLYIDEADGVLYGPKAANGWGTGISLIGPPGPAGPQGPPGSSGGSGNLLSGPRGPIGGTGKPGDFWLDTVSYVLYGPNTGVWPATGRQLGTVTSVGLAAPAEFSVSGSPITAAGTLTLTKAAQLANTFWRGPTSGGAAQPVFGPIVAADLPRVPLAIRAVSANTNVLLTDGVIECNCVSGVITVTCPASPVAGIVFTVTKTDSSANHVTINGNGFSILNVVSIDIATQFTSLDIYFDNAQYRVK